MGRAARNHGGTLGHGFLPLPGERPNFNCHVMSDQDLQCLVRNKDKNKLTRQGTHPSVKLPSNEVKQSGSPVKVVGTPVKLLGTPVKLSGTSVKLPGIPVKFPGVQDKLPGISVKQSKITVKQPRTPFKLPGSQDKLPGIPVQLPACKVKQQLILPEPVVQTQLHQTSEYLSDTQVKLSGTPVRLQDDSVMLQGIQVKLSGTPVKFSETPAKLPGPSIQLSGTSVRKQVISPEPTEQTQLLQKITSELLSVSPVKLPGTQDKLPMNTEGLTECLVKQPEIAVNLSENPVKLLGTPAPLPGIPIKLTDTPPKLQETAVKLTGTPVKLSGTPALLPEAPVRKQVIIPEPIVQTQQQQPLTSTQQSLSFFDQYDGSVKLPEKKTEFPTCLVQLPATKDNFLED